MPPLENYPLEKCPLGHLPPPPPPPQRKKRKKKEKQKQKLPLEKVAEKNPEKINPQMKNTFYVTVVISLLYSGFLKE